MIYADRTVFIERLAPQAFHNLIKQAIEKLRKLLISISTGAGKTYHLLQYIRSDVWRQSFGVVVLAFYTRDQIAEVASELQELGVRVAVYPDLASAPCMPNPAIADLYQKGQYLLMRDEHCRHCRHRRNKTCRFYFRTKASTYLDADVIIIPEQVLGVMPDIVDRITTDRGPALLVLDEVVSANNRFIVQFKLKNISDDLTVAASLHLTDVITFLSNPDTAPLPQEIGKAFFRMSVEGPKILNGYRCHLQEVIGWARASIRWKENDTYAFQRLPRLPDATVFMGAYLSPSLLAFLFDIPEPHNPFSGEIVVHSESRIYNLRTSAMAKGQRWRSAPRISNLIADFYVQQRAQGRRIVVLGSKGLEGRQSPSELVAGITTALACRQRHGVRIVHWQADDILPDDIVFLTYGATGSNRLKDHEALIAVNAFYIKPQVVQSILFGHLPPSQWQKVNIGRDRRCRVGTGMDVSLNNLASLILFRLEADVLLQAVGRVRQAVEPRLVILSSRYDLTPQIGPWSVITTFDEVREVLDLPDTKTAKYDARLVQAIVLAKQGMTKSDIAAEVGVSRSWLTTAFAAANLKLPRGRPPKALPATYTFSGLFPIKGPEPS